MTDLLPPPRTFTETDAEEKNSGVGRSAMEDTAFQHFTIGDNLKAKAFYQDAIDEFLKAFHIQGPLLGAESMEVARTHYALGLSYRAIKEFKQALYHLKKAASIYESKQDEEAKKSSSKDGEKRNSYLYRKEITNCKLNMARTHHSNGVALQRAGEYDASILEHRRSLAIREHL